MTLLFRLPGFIERLGRYGGTKRKVREITYERTPGGRIVRKKVYMSLNRRCLFFPPSDVMHTDSEAFEFDSQAVARFMKDAKCTGKEAGLALKIDLDAIGC